MLIMNRLKMCYITKLFYITKLQSERSRLGLKRSSEKQARLLKLTENLLNNLERRFRSCYNCFVKPFLRNPKAQNLGIYFIT